MNLSAFQYLMILLIKPNFVFYICSVAYFSVKWICD